MSQSPDNDFFANIPKKAPEPEIKSAPIESLPPEQPKAPLKKKTPRLSKKTVDNISIAILAKRVENEFIGRYFSLNINKEFIPTKEITPICRLKKLSVRKAKRNRRFIDIREAFLFLIPKEIK